MKHLILYKDFASNTWMVHHVDDLEIFEHFRTYDLPTCFTLNADPNEVLSTVTKLNPDKIVTLEN